MSQALASHFFLDKHTSSFLTDRAAEGFPLDKASAAKIKDESTLD